MPDPIVGSVRSSLADRLLGWRNALLSSNRFQLFAARTPIFRSIARRRSAQLFDIAAGFVYTQVLFACVHLELFDLLRQGALPLDDIARRTALPEAAADRLVTAAVALRLLERRRDGRIGLGMLGAALNGAPGVKAMMRHNQILYRDLTDPVALLRGETRPTALSRYWPYAADGAAREGITPDQVRAYTDLMAESQGFVADDLLDAYDVSRHARLMDIGGGDGSFLRSAGRRAPKLALDLVDLPAVSETARGRFAAAGMEQRVTIHGLDFQADALPEGADLVSLIRVAHDHDDQVVEALLKRIHAVLPPGGALMLGEPMAGVPGAEAMADAYFGLYLWAMGTGRARTAESLSQMLRNAGFASVKAVPTSRPLLTSLLVAKKAS